jgi:hypothetical protein
LAHHQQQPACTMALAAHQDLLLPLLLLLELQVVA